MPCADVEQGYAKVEQGYADVQSNIALVHLPYATVKMPYALVEQGYARIKFAYAPIQTAYALVKQSSLGIMVTNGRMNNPFLRNSVRLACETERYENNLHLSGLETRAD